MIKEDYVNFEVAKLLKEKGFNGECLSMYLTPKPYSGMGNPKEPKIAPHGRDSHYYEGYLYQCEAPTLQMVMKWLRETFEIHCQIDCPIAASNWVYGIRDLNKDEWLTDYRNMGDNDTYEEACEAAIKYCLENLI